MKAALLYGEKDFRIETVDDPLIKPDECLIEVKACGVCHSEIHQWNQKLAGLEYPRFIGHEVSGVILETGKAVSRFHPGDRVAVWADGKGYAEKLAVKQDYIFHLTDSIPFEQAMAEPIACTTNGVLKTDIRMHESVALVGCGFMGLILLQQLKLYSPSMLIAIDLRNDMLQLAKKLGADIVINPSRENTIEQIRQLTNGKGVDISFEVGGIQATLDQAADICRMEGRLVIFGYHPGQRIIKDMGYWNWMAFDIVNAHFRDIDQILYGTRLGMELLNAGKIDLKPLITHTFPLNKINDAFTAAKDKRGGFVKAVIIN